MLFKRKDLLLFLAPLIISLLFMVVVPRNPLQSDGREYDVLAKNIIYGKGYSLDGNTPYGLRPPLYSVIVALFYFMFKPNPYYVVAFQIILLMLVPYMIKRIMILGGFNESQSFWGALIVAIYPFGYVYAQQLITESVTTFLVVLAAFLSTNIIKRDNIKFTVTIGYAIVVTLPALAKSQHISILCAVLLLLACKAILERKELRKTSLKFLGVIIGAMIVLAPWGIRNYHHFQRPAILGYGAFGEGLLKGYYHAKGDWLIWRYWNENSSSKGPYFEEWKEKFDYAEDIAKAKNIDPDKVKTEIALQEIKSDPWEAFRGYIVRFYSLWIAMPKGDNASFKIKTLVLIIELCFLLLSLVGLILFRKMLIRNFAPIYLFVLAESVLLPLIDVESRYSISLKPFILVGLGLLLERIASKIFMKKRNG
jgi:hypothetical protein